MMKLKKTGAKRTSNDQSILMTKLIEDIQHLSNILLESEP